MKSVGGQWEQLLSNGLPVGMGAARRRVPDRALPRRTSSREALRSASGKRQADNRSKDGEGRAATRSAVPRSGKCGYNRSVCTVMPVDFVSLFLSKTNADMIERYSRPAMRAIWTEQRKFEAYLKVEILAA